MMNAIKSSSLKYTLIVQVLALTMSSTVYASKENNEVALRSVVGQACVQSSQCGKNYHCVEDKGTTRNGAKFSGGYCVKFDCSFDSPCDSGSKCVVPQGENFSVCLAACSSDTHCRSGYACHDEGVCLPVNF